MSTLSGIYLQSTVSIVQIIKPRREYKLFKHSTQSLKSEEISDYNEHIKRELWSCLIDILDNSTGYCMNLYHMHNYCKNCY